MREAKNSASPKQQLFQETVLGILIYAVILGFFEDYTNILNTWSYSTTFFVAVVLQFLTDITFRLKSLVVCHFKGRQGKKYTAALVVGVWGILFVSKFVFLAVIDFIFGSEVEISGFVGIAIIVITMTVTKKLIDLVYVKLA